MISNLTLTSLATLSLRPSPSTGEEDYAWLGCMAIGQSADGALLIAGDTAGKLWCVNSAGPRRSADVATPLDTALCRARHSAVSIRDAKPAASGDEVQHFNSWLLAALDGRTLRKAIVSDRAMSALQKSNNCS